VNALDTVLAKHGFSEDTDPVSTIIVGGPALAKSAVTASFDPADHPRHPSGSPEGGEFAAKDGGLLTAAGGNPYHEPAGSPKGGQFARKTGADAVADPAIGVPEFKSQKEAEQWFVGYGVPDVDLTGIEDIPHGLDVMRESALALVHESQLYPDIVGPNGLKAVLLGDNPRLRPVSIRYDFFDFNSEGTWGTTFPYEDLIDPGGMYARGQRRGAYQSVIVLNSDALGDSYTQIADMAASGMAPKTPEQAFAHELGHVHENTLGVEKSTTSYMQAAGTVEEQMAADAGVTDFKTQLGPDGDGTFSDPLAAVLMSISPYSLSSPREGYAEHFVRRTYPESYGRIRPDPPQLRTYADAIADEYDRLMGGHYL
jgi:hypothetical protein